MRLCEETMRGKTAEYTGGSADRLCGFKSAAVLQGCTPEQALAGMLAKHIVSIYDMCAAPRLCYAPEVWTEKITDSINYLVLLKALVVEDANG
ncbi:MAG: hypothetical protein PHO41_09535 [Eubacteriales bacterium]|nr:hypothetical protein [Eubacteriales bacterium]